MAVFLTDGGRVWSEPPLQPAAATFTIFNQTRPPPKTQPYSAKFSHFQTLKPNPVKWLKVTEFWPKIQPKFSHFQPRISHFFKEIRHFRPNSANTLAEKY